MSDYLFMLESHVVTELHQIVQVTEAAAARAGARLFITGGALRDMVGGWPVTSLEFTIEGNPAKVIKEVVAKTGAKATELSDTRKITRLVTPSGHTFDIGMSQLASYSKPGATPHIKPAPIHDDLKGRDFTLNAIALSLNPGSRGLLLDPANGLGDIEQREIRATNNYSLYDVPSRILRMLRFKVRLGFEIAERTRLQYENVRLAELEKRIPPTAVYAELRAMADEPDPAALLTTLEQEGLLDLYSPLLKGEKLNLAGLGKLQKLKQMVPFGADLRVNNLGIFLWVLTERFNAKEKAELIKRLGIPKEDIDAWQKLDQRSKKLESTLKSSKLNRASLVYQALQAAPGDQILFLLYTSTERLVQDRLKKYLTSYVPGVLEITDREVAAHYEIDMTSPKFAKAKNDYVMGRLDGRIRKPAPVEVELPPPQQPGRRGRPPREHA